CPRHGRGRGEGGVSNRFGPAAARRRRGPVHDPHRRHTGEGSMSITRGLMGLALGTTVLLAAAEPAMAQAAETSPPARASRWDWTADRRRFVEGDIITV